MSALQVQGVPASNHKPGASLVGIWKANRPIDSRYSESTPRAAVGVCLGLRGELLRRGRQEGLERALGQQLANRSRLQQVLHAVLQVHAWRVCRSHKTAGGSTSHTPPICHRLPIHACTKAAVGWLWLHSFWLHLKGEGQLVGRLANCAQRTVREVKEQEAFTMTTKHGWVGRPTIQEAAGVKGLQGNELQRGARHG